MSKGEQTRQTITEQAISMASQQGIGSLSIGSLASAVHMSKSGLFAHFGSKEALQLHVIEAIEADFAEKVLKPAFREPRGEQRIRKIMENWLSWTQQPALPGGCPFVQLGVELDDQPGEVRDRFVQSSRSWLDLVAKSARLAVEVGDFKQDLDPAQFAYEFHALMLAYHHASRLFRDPNANDRFLKSINKLIQSSRA